jgi:Tfp pilus assembly protein PilV
VRRLDARGLTLTEVTIVMVLASLVMFGLVGFYMASQSTWLDASGQAITQREATAILDMVTRRAHESNNAIVSASGSGVQIDFYRVGEIVPYWTIFWDGAQKQVQEGPTGAPFPGSTGSSAVERFEASRTDDFVDVAVELRSPQGQSVALSTRAVFNNRTP